MKSFMITMYLLGSATIIMGGPLNWLREFEDTGCVDKYPTEMCEKHAAAKGYCDDYRKFMEPNCARTCGFCQPQAPVVPGIGCKDEIEGCAEHASYDGYCEYTNTFMRIYCRRTCNFCRQPIGPPNDKEYFWETMPWGECTQGIEERGVRCIHVYEGKDYRVVLKACRDNLTNVPEPAEKRACA